MQMKNVNLKNKFLKSKNVNEHKVTFLFDHTNNWIREYINPETFVNSKKYNFSFTENYKEIKNQTIVFILSYTKILKKDFLKSNDLNLVIHASKLPKGKGFSPVQWQILDGLNNIPITLIEANEKVDSGAVLISDNFKLNGYELYDEIREKQAKATIKIIKNFLNIFPNYSKTCQKGKETIYRRRNLNDGKLNLNLSLRKQFNHLRIANNDEWPSYFIINKKKYIIKIYKG